MALNDLKLRPISPLHNPIQEEISHQGFPVISGSEGGTNNVLNASTHLTVMNK